ncbi:chorismate mutase [Varunaivibrio sulfuroxidans]|nr:chorismate mutase [Varunaivibrio sulfuroxidans]WES32110.1 chorismate mutase [Varunaivibrio sulfuroxidans]
MMSIEKSLEPLRREIDAIDVQIHDLLMRRTQVVEKVRAVKHDVRIKIRPAREAEIIYRLLERHKGPFPKRELFRIWRELIVATLSFEGPFSVAVYMTGEDCGYWDMARDQFGSYTPMTPHTSARHLIEVVRAQTATVGVLPAPTRQDADPWWWRLVAEGDEVPKIIARLPFAGPGNARSGNMEALVICPVGLEPTGRDRTYLAFETDSDITLSRLQTALKENGFTLHFGADWNDPSRPTPWLYLVELEGFISAKDPRLSNVRDAFGDEVKRLLSLGGYSTCLSPDELDTPS